MRMILTDPAAFLDTLTATVLAVVSAAATHAAVRMGGFRSRLLLCGVALLTFVGAAIVASGVGGFWTGFYTVIAVYILTSTLSPWIIFLWEHRRAD